MSLFVDAGGGRWLPTETARGPWTPDALHGGPPAALLGREAETLLGDLQPVRMTVELLRPVPVAPLTVSARESRPGRKVRLVEASLVAGDIEVARAMVLGIRRADVPVAGLPGPGAPPSGPETGTPGLPRDTGYDAFHNTGVDHSFVAGQFGDPGPATDWIRLRVPVVPGEEPSPLQRVVAAADFGNGVSGVATFDELLYINPDLTVYLHRLPAGEWICLDAVTRMEQHGVALAESRLYDQHGEIGIALQSLIVEPRRS